VRTKKSFYSSLVAVVAVSAFLAGDAVSQGPIVFYEVCGYACDLNDEGQGSCTNTVDFAEARCCIYLAEYDTCGEMAKCECQNCFAGCGGF
jgi:hypothetical protein